VKFILVCIWGGISSPISQITIYFVLLIEIKNNRFKQFLGFIYWISSTALE
jgi:hypothetical protein